MTIGVTWLRKGKDAHELWIATDSRLSGDGYIWDDCPKIMLLPRRDAVAAFAGSTGQAFPLMHQAASAIGAYPEAADGTLEFFAMAGHVKRVVNAMMDRLRLDPAVRGADPTRREFASDGDAIVLGGYSRHKGTVTAGILACRAGSQDWNWTRMRRSREYGPNRQIMLFRDRKARTRYGFLLRKALADKGDLDSDASFDIEPLTVLSTYLRMPESRTDSVPSDHRPATIGGAPQLVRVLEGGQATPFAVRWTDDQGTADHLLGRRCFLTSGSCFHSWTTPDGITIRGPGQWKRLGLFEE